MEIVEKLIERIKLEDFADKHKLTLEIHERSEKDWVDNNRPFHKYYAEFGSCEIKEGCVLSSAYGNGSTKEEAIEDYKKQISNVHLVFGAYTKKRKDIITPYII